MANNNINKPPVEGDSLLSYLNNELNKADKHKLEEQMLEDEFLADAAEGLGMVKNKAALAANIAAINAGVSSSLKSSTTAAPAKSFLSVIGNTAAIAATIALLVGAAYFISQYSATNSAKETTVVDNKVAPQQPQFAPLNDGSNPTIEESPAADSLSTATTATENNKVFAPNANYYKYTPVVTNDVYDADEAAPAENIPVGNGTKDMFVAEPAKKLAQEDIDISMYGPASNNNFNQAPVKLSTKTTSNDRLEKSKKESKLKSRNEDVSSGDDAPGVYMDGILIKKDNDDKSVTTQASNPTRATVTGKKESTPSEITDKALNYYKNGDYKGALGELEILLKKELRQHESHLLLRHGKQIPGQREQGFRLL
ncbi:MAG: hypothetical protein M0D57_17445 [Sphingobacteriales bacterium JAD_PAG50586_3]|nr:MAG: hypothetical protein M0D57_17445 [Sphingobacteriales bacterium JAD_PAG50586_3]